MRAYYFDSSLELFRIAGGSPEALRQLGEETNPYIGPDLELMLPQVFDTPGKFVITDRAFGLKWWGWLHLIPLSWGSPYLRCALLAATPADQSWTPQHSEPNFTSAVRRSRAHLNAGLRRGAATMPSSVIVIVPADSPLRF